MDTFSARFEKLTGKAPFPWQSKLYDEEFSKGRIPASCNLPTGLGKTSVIAIWLIALANGAQVPRRLVYVVNRRTVVDQTTDEVNKYRINLKDTELDAALRQLYFRKKSPTKDNKKPPEWESPLALSTLRGQFADTDAE